MRNLWRYAATGVVVVLALQSIANAGVQVLFDQGTYTVQPGEDFQVQLFLDADDSQPGIQSLANGLYSMGVKLTFGNDNADVASIADIILPAAVDNDGAGGPAIKDVGAGFAGAAGAVNLSSDFYYDSLLATITIADLDFGSYPYSLNLDFYYNGGRDNFLDGTGTNIDNTISFGSATVVPEPLTLGVMGLGGLVLLRRRKRK